MHTYPGVGDIQSLTEGLCDENAGAKKPDFVARRRRFLVRAFAELAGAVVVAQLKVASSHLVIKPRAFQRRFRHRQSHIPSAPDNNNNWLSHTLTEHLMRQAQQQRWQLPGRRTSMLTLAPVTSLSQLRLRPWAFSTHQLATSCLILEGGSPSILARLERPAIYFNGFLFWCSALMLFCCMTVCTARTDDRTHLCIA